MHKLGHYLQSRLSVIRQDIFCSKRILKLNQKHIGIVPQILGFSQTNICKNYPRFGGNAAGHGRGLAGRGTFDQTARLVTPLHTTCFRKPRNRREVVCQSAGKLQHEGAADAKCETTHKH